jgi:hypothetical protein
MGVLMEVDGGFPRGGFELYRANLNSPCCAVLTCMVGVTDMVGPSRLRTVSLMSMTFHLR